MGKRFKSYCLILVSMIMLTALVIPHHHHGDIPCMKHRVDATTEDCSDIPAAKQSHDDFCKISCATHILLNKVDFKQDLTPCYSFFSILFDFVKEQMLVNDSVGLANHEIYYYERLFPQCLVAVSGWRAPPVHYFL